MVELAARKSPRSFRDIDPIRLAEVEHNPVLLLEQYPPGALEKRATEMVLHTRIN